MDIKKEVVKQFLQYYYGKGIEGKHLTVLAERVFQDYSGELLAECFDALELESSLLSKNTQEKKETAYNSATNRIDEDDETITIKIPKALYVKITAPDKVQGILEAIKEYYQIDL